MPQFNQLNLPAIDQAAQQTAGNAFNMQRAQVNAGREDQKYDEDQKLQNTRWLAGATRVLQDVHKKDPDSFYVAAEELGTRGIEMGVIDPNNWDPQAITIDKVNDIHNQAMVGLGGKPINKADPAQAVGKTWVNPETQTMWGMRRNGQPFDTGVPAQQYSLAPVSTADGTRMVDRSRQPQGRSGVGPVIQGTSPTEMGAVEAANAAAKEQASTDVKATEEYRQLQQANRATYKAYEVARNGLMAGLSGTSTGYFAGKIPPITEGQQIAEGGVAAIAPILKQLFRAAGEGIFTDKDQELLMAMVPTRDDLEDARVTKMELIDRIVRSKLQIDEFDTLQQARDAIEKGADPAQVHLRLQGMGIDPRKL